MEFNHDKKGDALHAMELALSLEVAILDILLDLICRMCTFPENAYFVSIA